VIDYFCSKIFDAQHKNKVKMIQKLQNKRIILGITGGIAAYKSAFLTRLFKQAGAEVIVVMTRSAKEFITPLTLQALSGGKVRENLLDEEAEGGMGHIALARWADVIVVAPASANFIARFVRGQADDLLTTVCLASRASCVIAPAMNQEMWKNTRFQINFSSLKKCATIVGPCEGEQACGDFGTGRMAEPDEIAYAAAQLFETGILAGKRVLITAGPTREFIDPVRFLSNRSSGKMGYALATAAQEAGAKVTLISGPVALTIPERVGGVLVDSADEMYNAVMERVSRVDIFIGCAAVADYTCLNKSAMKIKKTNDTMTLQLSKTRDILASIGKKPNRPLLVGFAAETEQVEAYAKKKLADKNLDMVIGNKVGSDLETGFDQDENEVMVITRQKTLSLERQFKTTLARELMPLINDLCTETQTIK
jgi:phosphopantothenoylcysteine decarboxylase/phosphopantothenate--cysteine ligase